MSNVHNVQYAHRISAAILLILIILLSLNAISPATTLSASSEAARWTRVSIPTQGIAGGWVLADGSDIQYLTAASDSTLYAYGKGLAYTLYKSTDGGIRWSSIGRVQDAIKGIAVSPHDPATIYYATAATVFRSTDGGNTFIQMPFVPGGAGTGNIEITSLAVTWLNYNIIAIGTRDTDGSDFGGVYTLEEADNFPGWTDTDIGSYDVYAVAFSPGYSFDRELVAVATDETDTFVFSKIANADWSAFIGPARLDRDNSGIPTAIATATSAGIAFPGDYRADTASLNRSFFVGVATGSGEGDVYKITSANTPAISSATDLNIGSAYADSNTDITGLAIYSNASSTILLAGAAESSQTCISTDGGTNWTRSIKAPTGGSATCVIMSPDFAATGKMYAATSGNGSALSVSRDTGASWNQVSFIDTTIDNIVDLAPSPVYSQDNTLFMITSGGEKSLWRSADGAITWERVFSSDFADVDSFNLVILSPQYSSNHREVFIAGTGGGNPAIWSSHDNGQSFWRQFTRDPATGAAFSVDAWAIDGSDTLYVGGYDGVQGLVYQTTNGGFFCSVAAPAGALPLCSVALSPDHENDGTILLGNSGGWVYWSNDNGASFQPLPLDAALPPLAGNVAVAFDPGYATNRIIYAASDTANGGIYRFTVGQSTEWESIDATLPAGAMINRLAVSNDGILYATSVAIDGSLERSLNPGNASGATFETVATGLSDGSSLAGLRQRDCRLWAIDSANGKLMTYLDTLATPAVPVSPANGTSSTGNLIDHTVKNITIDWETIDGATGYEWQCSYETDFSSIPDGLEDTSSSSSVRLPDLEPATTYYWRVRACAPVFSPWSLKWSFTTSMDTEIVTLKPEIPASGAAGVSVKPVFQWTAVVGAEAYELLVAADADFTSPAIVKTNDYALPTNAWQCDVSLDYATTYYWKIRATASGTCSAWSSAGVFTTESAPASDDGSSDELTSSTSPTLQDSLSSLASSKTTAPLNGTSSPELFPPPATSTPASSVPAQSLMLELPAWLIYLIGGLLSAVMLSLIIVLVMVLKMRRIT